MSGAELSCRTFPRYLASHVSIESVEFLWNPTTFLKKMMGQALCNRNKMYQRLRYTQKFAVWGFVCKHSFENAWKCKEMVIN